MQTAMPTARITVTLPAGVVEEIDRLERNRSRFVREAVRREIRRRRRGELRHSFRRAHAESGKLVDLGLGAWAKGLPPEDVGELLDPGGGKGVRWTPGRGWVATRS